MGGVDFSVLSFEALERHALAFGERDCDSTILRDPGFLHFRSGGEKHVNDPSSVALLQEATRCANVKFPVPTIVKQTFLPTTEF